MRLFCCIIARGMIRKPKHQQLLILLSAVLAVVLSAQTYLMGEKAFWGGTYTHYNNYVIFKYSFHHLLSGANLYELHLTEHADFFKYSPSFALFMAPFWCLPDALGLCLWNWVNIFAVVAGLSLLITNRNRFWWALLFVLPELVVATQNSQSNALIAGLLLFAFSALKKEETFKAAAFVVIAVFIKPFAAAFFLLLPFVKKPKQFLLFSSIIGIVVLLLPALVVGLEGLLHSYKNWFALLQKDEQKSLGYSAYAVANAIGISSKLPVFLLGLVLLLLPLINYKTNATATLCLAQMLLWMLVFNFKAESPGYILAMTGAALWLFDDKITRTKISVAAVCFATVSMVKMDFIPASIKSTETLQVLCPLLPLLIMLLIAGQSLQSFRKNKLAKAIAP